MPKVAPLLLMILSLFLMAVRCEKKEFPLPSLDIPGAAQATVLPNKPAYTVGDTIWLLISLNAEDLENWPAYQQANYTLMGQLQIDMQPGETGPFIYADYMTWVFPDDKNEITASNFTYNPVTETFSLSVGWKVLKPRQYKLGGNGLAGLDLESDAASGTRFQYDYESLYVQANLRNDTDVYGYIPVVFPDGKTTMDIVVN